MEENYIQKEPPKGRMYVSMNITSPNFKDLVLNNPYVLPKKNG